MKRIDYNKKIYGNIYKAIDNKNEKLYIKEIKKAIRYFLSGKISLDTLDSIGATYLPYMKISKKYEDVLATISCLELEKIQEKLLKNV